MNTNVVITALKAAEPQSQDAQARIRPLLETWLPVASSEDGCDGPGSAGAVHSCIVSAEGEHEVDAKPWTAGELRARSRRNCEGLAPQALINWRLPNLTFCRLLQLLTIEFLTLRRYQ